MSPGEGDLLRNLQGRTIGPSGVSPKPGRPWFGPSVLVAVGYAAAFYFLGQALREIPVGVAYAIWSGVGIVLITLAGWLIHGQRLDGFALVGIALIVSGVVIMNVFSSSTAH